MNRPSNIPPDTRDHVWIESDFTDAVTYYQGFPLQKVSADIERLICNYLEDNGHDEIFWQMTLDNCYLELRHTYFIVWWCRPTTEAEKQHWDKEVAAKQKKALADKLRRAKRKEKLELKEREQLRLLKAKYEK